VLRSDRHIPSSPGSYLLVLYLSRQTKLQVGRLGSVSFKRGWYFYAGSAFGPGGLCARLTHHFQPLRRYHWHIDYLRDFARVRSVWYQLGQNNEHRWSELLVDLPTAENPLRGFGSSDCLCRSHLVHIPRHPGQRLLRNLLTEQDSIYCFHLKGTN
jgi:Uri superfamily endonuclease